MYIISSQSETQVARLKKICFAKEARTTLKIPASGLPSNLKIGCRDPCNQIAPESYSPNVPCHFPCINCHKSEKILDYLPFAFTPFTFYFFSC